MVRSIPWITMNPPSTPQTPSGPLTRARGHAIETKVTSFLYELSILACATWLLPHFETFRILGREGIKQREGLEGQQGSSSRRKAC